MRRMLILGTGLASLCAGLAACATPAYPISAAERLPAPVQPRDPTIAQAASPTMAAPVVTDQGIPGPASAASVGSKPLPPIGASSAPSSAPSAAESAAVPTPYTPPPPRVRTEGRLVTNGRVVSATHMFRDYEVRKGDHLFAIARDFQTTADALVDANGLKSANALRPGQHLKIPIEKAYVAESGDTLAGVAKRFGVGVGELSDLNNLPARGRLRGGDKIALPAHFEDHGATRLAAEYIEARPTYRPTRAPRESSSVLSAGPYVPSRAALEAGARRRAEEQAAGTQATLTPYRPSTSYQTTQPSAPPPADVIASGRGRFIWPVQGEILSPFGVKDVGRKNDGIDVKAAQGTSVHAAASGEVVYAGDQVPGFGNLVLIKHADGWVTAYAHLDRALVHMRQSVMQGDEIGQVGQSGGVTEPQLHFEIRYAPRPTDKARPIDPALVLPK